MKIPTAPTDTPDAFTLEIIDESEVNQFYQKIYDLLEPKSNYWWNKIAQALQSNVTIPSKTIESKKKQKRLLHPGNGTDPKTEYIIPSMVNTTEIDNSTTIVSNHTTVVNTSNVDKKHVSNKKEEEKKISFGQQVGLATIALVSIPVTANEFSKDYLRYCLYNEIEKAWVHLNTLCKTDAFLNAETSLRTKKLVNVLYLWKKCEKEIFSGISDTVTTKVSGGIGAITLATSMILWSGVGVIASGVVLGLTAGRYLWKKNTKRPNPDVGKLLQLVKQAY